MMNTPCNPDCEKRSVACHSTCSKYLKWKSQHEKDKALKRQYAEDCSRVKPKTVGYQKIRNAAIKLSSNGEKWK
jgi:hypothetical protein